MQRTLDRFIESVVLTGRPTDVNLLDTISGGKFFWESAPGMPIADEDLFLCPDGYLLRKATREPTLSVTTVTGSWTVIRTAAGSVWLGTSSELGFVRLPIRINADRNGIIWGNQEFFFEGPTNCN